MDISDEFLTLDQAKELQELGIDFSGSNFGIYNFYESLNDDEVTEIRPIDKIINDKLVTPTLSVAEMIEMLPKCIEVKDVLCELYLKKSSFYVGDMTYELGYRGYLNESLSIKEFTYPLLRDALFEMLKWLKQNKMI